jgi:WD40 repeat protein
VFSGSGSDVYVWDAATGAQLAILEGHGRSVAGITVTSDGSFAAFACEDTILVWDLTDFSLVTKFSDFSPIRAVLFMSEVNHGECFEDTPFFYRMLKHGY